MYDFDETGSNPANLIENEVATLTEVNGIDYRVVIPDFAPFYTTNLVVKHNNTVLQEGVDYVLVFPYIAATRSVGITVYGGISFNFTYPNGTIKITYQTIGNPWIGDSAYAYQVLAEKAYNQRVTSWDVLTNVQQIFPPVNHDQMLDYVYDYGDLLTKIGEISDAIGTAAIGYTNPAFGAVPDRVVVTNSVGSAATSSVMISDLQMLIAAHSTILNRLNQAETKIADLLHRVQTLEAQ